MTAGSGVRRQFETGREGLGYFTQNWKTYLITFNREKDP